MRPNIQGKNRVREQRSHGSVRGVPSNRHPYRDRNWNTGYGQRKPTVHQVSSTRRDPRAFAPFQGFTRLESKGQSDP